MTWQSKLGLKSFLTNRKKLNDIRSYEYKERPTEKSPLAALQRA